MPVLPNRVRPLSRKSGSAKPWKRYRRLKAMDCFAEVHERLVKGWPASGIAQWIQEDKNEYTDVSRTGLIKMLTLYRNEIPAHELAAHALPVTHQRAVDTVVEGLDAMAELQKLYELQMDRIKIDATTEKNINKLFKTTVREVKAAREILMSYAQLQMDFGLTKRNLGTLEVDAGAPPTLQIDLGNDRMSAVAEDPKSRLKCLTMVDRILALHSKTDDEALEADDEEEGEPGRAAS